MIFRGFLIYVGSTRWRVEGAGYLIFQTPVFHQDAPGSQKGTTLGQARHKMGTGFRLGKSLFLETRCCVGLAKPPALVLERAI